jgi:hypothetical protein
MNHDPSVDVLGITLTGPSKSLWISIVGNPEDCLRESRAIGHAVYKEPWHFISLNFELADDTVPSIEKNWHRWHLQAYAITDARAKELEPLPVAFDDEDEIDVQGEVVSAPPQREE